MRVSRQSFLASLLGVAIAPLVARSAAPDPAGRGLNFVITDDFGGAAHADIIAVARSAADAIWRHCPHTRWELPGFLIYHSNPDPITLNDHQADGRIAIGLTVQGKYWSQVAFQFAHEFGHALAGHSNDWRLLNIRPKRPNHWLEESICEVASLFALRSMGKTWKDAPPYPNWASYAPHLTSYAKDRLQDHTTLLKDGVTFLDWFHANETSMRENATQRSKNNVVAAQLLPLFEAEPAGWESLTSYNLAPPDPTRSLREQFANWQKLAPVGQRPFICKLATVFGVPCTP